MNDECTTSAGAVCRAVGRSIVRYDYTPHASGKCREHMPYGLLLVQRRNENVYYRFPGTV